MKISAKEMEVLTNKQQQQQRTNYWLKLKITVETTKS